ncbi:MAG: PP0621 family protein [Burkholderiales bacterium]
MLKLLVIIAVIALAIWIWKGYGRSAPKPRQAAPGEDMVRCVQCGVHLPKSESLIVRGSFFCSEAHRQLHQQKNGS